MTDHHPKSFAVSETEPKVCFVIPYFGKWPFWFPFYLESCRANPSIHWLLHTVTDHYA